MMVCLCVHFCLLLSHIICSRQSDQTSSLLSTNLPVAWLQASPSRCLGPQGAFGAPIHPLPLVLWLLSLHFSQGLLSVSGTPAGTGSSCPSAWNSLVSEDFRVCFTGKFSFLFTGKPFWPPCFMTQAISTHAHSWPSLKNSNK